MYANSPHGHGLMAAPAGFNRSFSDINGFQQHAMEKPQIYTVCPPLLTIVPGRYAMLTL